MAKKLQRIYDGSFFCSQCSQCPVVEYDKTGRKVILRDPAKPEKGKFLMTVAEYNAFVRHAPAIRQ